MDETDRRLIDLLRDNARAPVAELARRLGLSRTTVQSRIARLQRSGVIAGYSVRIADAVERAQIRAYVLITAHPKRSAAVIAGMKRMTGVRLLQSVSGAFDMVALVEAGSVDAMDALIDAIGELEGVERTTSSLVLSTKIER
jgi:DNA-binding Lrp family transcriptional regulator